MDRLEALAFFMRIVEKGGVAAAGRDFGLSPATASERLAALESHYGATLLNRTTRSVSLTEAGRMLMEGAEPLVAEAQDLEGRIKYGAETLSGWIRLSAPEDFGATRLTPVIDKFLEQNPKIMIELRLSDDYLDLSSQGLDLAIRLGALKDSSLIVRKLGNNHRIICASPEYLKAFGTPVHPDELLDHNCLIMRQGSVIDQGWRFTVEGKSRFIIVSGNRMSNSGLEVRKWCLAGQGIALKSTWDVGEDIKEGRLIELLRGFEPQSESAMQIIYPGSGKPSRRVRALIDFLVENLAQRRLA